MALDADLPLFFGAGCGFTGSANFFSAVFGGDLLFLGAAGLEAIAGAGLVEGTGAACGIDSDFLVDLTTDLDLDRRGSADTDLLRALAAFNSALIAAF